MARYKIILNPKAGRGYAARIAPGIQQCLDGLGLDYDLVKTSGPGDAIDLAQQAVREGFDTVVSVGGDGTSHEVVNGLMAAANGHPPGTLGWIPAGSGNDFAMMNGAPADITEACELLATGQTRLVDVGRLTIDGQIQRYFDNVVGIGFDGLVLRETQKIHVLRGLALYLPCVLKTIFLTMRPMDAAVAMDGQRERLSPLMIIVANGRREGGGFLVAPDARCTDGLFDVIVADWMPRLRVLSMVPRFLSGTHLSDPLIAAHHARHVVIESEEPLYAHVDGEILSDEAHRIEIEVLPRALRVICPEANAFD